MEKRISISQAARLLDITTKELNTRIAAANIPTFEGEVDLEQVKCVAPSLKLSDPAILKKVQYLRENTLHPIQNLDRDQGGDKAAGEMQKIASQLMIEVQEANHYREIINELVKELGHHQLSGEPGKQELAFELCRWLRERICAD